MPSYNDLERIGTALTEKQIARNKMAEFRCIVYHSQWRTLNIINANITRSLCKAQQHTQHPVSDLCWRLWKSYYLRKIHHNLSTSNIAWCLRKVGLVSSLGKQTFLKIRRKIFRPADWPVFTGTAGSSSVCWVPWVGQQESVSASHSTVWVSPTPRTGTNTNNSPGNTEPGVQT